MHYAFMCCHSSLTDLFWVEMSLKKMENTTFSLLRVVHLVVHVIIWLHSYVLTALVIVPIIFVVFVVSIVQRHCKRFFNVLKHYENMSVQYVAISKSGKNDIFRCNKCDIFFLFLLKT